MPSAKPSISPSTRPSTTCHAAYPEFWDPTTKTFISKIVNNGVLCRSSSALFTIRSDKIGCPTSYVLRFNLNGFAFPFERNPPFLVFSNTGATWNGRPSAAGNYVLDLSVYDDSVPKEQVAGTTKIINFTISNSCRRSLIDQAAWTRQNLLNRFFQAEFQGMSGEVSYINDGRYQRDPAGISIGAYLLQSVDANNNTSRSYSPEMLSVYRTESGWEDLSGASLLGSTKRMRITFDSNFISSGSRMAAFVLLLVVLVLAASDLICLYCYARKQPLSHVYLVIFGSVISSFSMLTQSFDENVQWMSPNLDEACLLSVWLFFTGNALVVATLVAVLYRTDIARRRMKVNFSIDLRISLPSLFYLATIVLGLMLWSVIDPLVWGRWDVAKVPLETFGLCQSKKHTKVYFGCLIGLSVSLLLAAVTLGLRNLRTHRDVESMMQGSCLMLQAWVFGLSMHKLVGTSSADGNYLVRIIFVWVVSMTGLVLVATPVAYRHTKQHYFPETVVTPRFRSTILMAEAVEEPDFFGLPFTSRGYCGNRISRRESGSKQARRMSRRPHINPKIDSPTKDRLFENGFLDFVVVSHFEDDSVLSQ
jgi:hypothetical protein